jgi:hypothetical protein
MYQENRFATIRNNFPEKATEFLGMANEAVQRKWERLEALKNL